MTGEASGRRGALILGVDDDAVNLRLLREIIEGMGHSFLGARSGEECLRLLHRAAPRLILLDVMMPDLDGFETCRRIRAEFALIKAPVVFLTALHSPEDVARGIGANGNDFIIKPFKPERLRQRVTYWLRTGLPADQD